MPGVPRRLRGPAAFAGIALLAVPALAGFVTFGQGWGSKWDDPVHPNPAVISWGFMPDGTTVDPAFFIADELVGGSDVTQLRADYDTAHGAGAFDAALARAFATWELVAGVSFVGPVADPGLPVGSPGATTPDIRVGAFEPVPFSGFDFVAGVGFGPPGDDLNFPDPLAGDILLNLAANFIEPAGDEGDPIGEFGNDLENLFLHELGHAAMGLGHPEEAPGEVMYVGPGCCDAINRVPSPDDIAGAQTVYGASATPACDNGIDDDGDGLVDLADPGCADAADGDERSAALVCDNGLDDDGDGRIDFDPVTFADPAFAAGSGDPGCRDPGWAFESPQCQNGLNDDNMLGTDFDGGVSVLGEGNGDLDGADPQCGKPWINREKKGRCGLGFEVALALLPLMAARRHRRRA